MATNFQQAQSGYKAQDQEKAYQKLLDEQKDTEKKRSEAEVKLVQLQNDILAKQTEIEKLKSELEDLKNKRTNFNQQ